MKPEQLELIKKQLEDHQHDDYAVDLVIAPDLTLKAFEVHAGVLRSDRMVALNFARWLYAHNTLYDNKTVLDMGSGSGIQGIVMALAGAQHITFNDNSELAVRNTRANINKYELTDRTTVYHGDLFERIEEQVDIGVFNHPFFSTEEHPFFDDPLVRELIIPSAMIDDSEIMQRYLVEARTYIKERIFMPFYHPAGETNNPSTQGPKHGYQVCEVHNEQANIGQQQGRFSVYELRTKTI